MLFKLIFNSKNNYVKHISFDKLRIIIHRANYRIEESNQRTTFRTCFKLQYYFKLRPSLIDDSEISL